MPATAQSTRDTIRLTRYIAAAACATPPSGAAFDRAQTALACLLVSLLKRLKLFTQQSGGGAAAPPAAYRAVADVAHAAAALGRAVAASTTSSSSTAAGKRKGKSGSSSGSVKGRSPAGGSSSPSSSSGPSSSDIGSVKKGPALWAVVAGHCLWWLGSQLPAALGGATNSSSSSSGWGVDDAPEQVLGTFRVASESLAWLAATLPSLPAAVALASTAAWSERWQALQQQLESSVQPAVQAAAAGGAAGLQWQQEVKGACAGLVELGTGLAVLLPCGVCCNRTGCCQLSTESERGSVGSSDRKVLLKCSACKLAHTDCKACFKLAWPLHKSVCKLAAGGDGSTA